MKICPNDPTHKEFTTTGVEYHDWIVDGHGHFLDDKGCYDARIGDGGWRCHICGTLAVDSVETRLGM